MWAVFEDRKRVISRISLRFVIKTRVHLESTRNRALRLEKADQAGVRSQSISKILIDRYTETGNSEGLVLQEAGARPVEAAR